MTKLKKNIKQPTKRSRSKYPALEKATNLKTRQSDIDDVKEYLHKLSPDEKEWMNTFMEEYNNANFNHGKKSLHKTKKLRKDCYNRNNSRNRCISSKEEAKGMLNYFEKLEDVEQDIQNNAEEIDQDIYYEPKMKL